MRLEETRGFWPAPSWLQAPAGRVLADLAAYNNGKLHGVWINACDDVEDIQEQISKMLAESPEGFAEELTEECTQIPENLARYIDYNAMAYDMEVGGDIFTIELAHGDGHIFWNH